MLLFVESRYTKSKCLFTVWVSKKSSTTVTLLFGLAKERSEAVFFELPTTKISLDLK